MSTHIGAVRGQIAPVVLLPGDPVRAQRIAEAVLHDVVPYNTVRNMLGYTGLVNVPSAGEVRVSVQGSGMDMPSLSIYASELFDHDVQTIIRVGTCGGLHADMKSGDLVIAQGACSDGNLNRRRYKGLDFAPIADADLFVAAVLAARARDWKVKAGNILSTDLFYADHVEFREWKMWAASDVIAVEMESAELYTLAARKGRRALSILTVSDVLPTGDVMTSQERETSFGRMVELALAATFTN